MPAPLNGHAFAPVLLEHLQVAASNGLPLGALVLWGFVRQKMSGQGMPVRLEEDELMTAFGTSARTIRRWQRILEKHKPPWAKSKRGWPRAYWALLPDEKADTDVRFPAEESDTGVRLPGEKADTDVRESGHPRPHIRKETVRVKKQQKTTRRGKGAAPPDPRVKTFIDWFCKAHQTATGTSYVVCGAKDGALIKGLLRKLDGDGRDPLVDLQAAAEAMLADKWGKDRASIGLLSSQINTWRKKGGQAKAPGAKYAGGF